MTQSLPNSQTILNTILEQSSVHDITQFSHIVVLNVFSYLDMFTRCYYDSIVDDIHKLEMGVVIFHGVNMGCLINDHECLQLLKLMYNSHICCVYDTVNQATIYSRD